MAKPRKVKAWADLSPATRKRYMRVLQTDNEKAAQRILRKMEERGVTRKRLRGHAPESKARPAKLAKPVTPLAELRKTAALHIAVTIGRYDALEMLLRNSEAFDRDEAEFALEQDADGIRWKASEPAAYEIGEQIVNPYWYHVQAFT